MYKGRRVKKTARNHRRAGRNLMLLLAAVLLLGAVTVGTVAYFTATAQSTSNGMTIGKVECEVSGPDNGIYTVKNTGTVDAYIRVAVVANAVDGKVIQWETPTGIVVSSTDFTENDTDGFWYSNSTVMANGGEATLTVKGAGTGVQVQVIAEAIQGQAAAANNAWTTHTY